MYGVVALFPENVLGLEEPRSGVGLGCFILRCLQLLLQLADAFPHLGDAFFTHLVNLRLLSLSTPRFATSRPATRDAGECTSVAEVSPSSPAPARRPRGNSSTLQSVTSKISSAVLCQPDSKPGGVLP